MVVRLHSSWGQVTLLNIYNDCEHDRTLHKLMEYHRKNCRNLVGSVMGENTHHVMWVGDFNRHHPAWDSLEDTRLFTKNVLDTAEVLIRMTVELRLDTALLAGMPTNIHNITKRWTCLDQV